tara:strand:+ start:1102 stop:1938 length:837 start_codon:yes stop_codon:yes gene_type:complete
MNCLNKQTTGLTRNAIDKFYTKPSISELCLELFEKKVKIDKNKDYFIEPSAGNGSFSNLMYKKYDNCLFYDIDPENVSTEYNIIKQDYLDLDLHLDNKVHLIGNPPFGRQSSLARKFIKKSATFCDTISFILPKSFKKDSFQKTFPLNFHLIYQYDLPENSFLIDGKEYDVPCVFQIWVKKKNKRKVKKKEIPKYFSFVKKGDNPDLSFRRVGVYAGKIDKNYKNKSIQSHYFIKLNDNINLDTFLERYSKIRFENNNTVGPKSICKPELIEMLNKMF